MATGFDWKLETRFNDFIVSLKLDRVAVFNSIDRKAIIDSVHLDHHFIETGLSGH